MNIYLLSSNQYAHLLQPFSVLFNKYWSTEQCVKVLCYRIPEVSLPSNFELISIGVQGQYWSNALIDYFTNKCTEKYFIINVEDMFLCDHVDVAKIRRLEEEVDTYADKASLHAYHPEQVTDNNNSDILLFNQNLGYRASIHPAIWRREYWLRCLKTNMTLWQFELQPDTINDGAKYIVLRNPQRKPIFDTCNIMVKGEPDVTALRLKPGVLDNGFCYAEDLEFVSKYLGK